MSIHRVVFPSLATAVADDVTVSGDEAHHLARVRRVGAGAEIELLDGKGHRARATVKGIEKRREGWAVHARVTSRAREGEVTPRIEVWASAPKGDRLAQMIEGLSQVGAASWAPLMSERTVVEPGAHKLDRLMRVASESLKQCGRAWALEILDGGDLRAAISMASGGTLVVADAGGAACVAVKGGNGMVRLLIGPEGGFTPEELALVRDAGGVMWCFSPHTMRIETAAVAGAAIVREAFARGVRGVLSAHGE
jgi:16S rRNA (uracil1498-N3)-methyltransferase